MPQARKTKAEKEPPVYCEKCNAQLTPTERRVYLENLYGIDPKRDKRQECFKCKGEIYDS